MHGHEEATNQFGRSRGWYDPLGDGLAPNDAQMTLPAKNSAVVHCPLVEGRVQSIFSFDGILKIQLWI